VLFLVLVTGDPADRRAVACLVLRLCLLVPPVLVGLAGADLLAATDLLAGLGGLAIIV
jgi:hypothetical protein